MIPEDARYNGYILRPLVTALATEAGRAPRLVHVLQRPGPQGYEAAVAWIQNRLEDYATYQLSLFLPDRDGHDGKEGRSNREAALAALERSARSKGQWLLCCAAIEELETWLMCGHPTKLREMGTTVSDVQAARKPSEHVFPQFLARYGDQSVGEGREALALDGFAGVTGLTQRCPELAKLLERIRIGDGRPETK
ncbi:MAG: hypothetical protein WCJ30_07005 [Deltaproteobacteria bacterium]